MRRKGKKVEMNSISILINSKARLWRHYITRFLPKRLCGDRGSASVEFIAFAIPLFIPLFFYLNQYSLQSDVESSLRTMSREMARSFVVAGDDEQAFNVVEEVFIKSAEILGFAEESDSGDLVYSIECENSPCISSKNVISIRVELKSAHQSVVAREVVSQWA